MSRLIIYIIIASLLPVLKQMYILKYLNVDSLAVYGLLFAVASFFIGFSHLGWAEISAIKTSQNKSIYKKDKFFSYQYAIHSILFINILFIPMILYIQNIELVLLPFVVIFTLSMSLFHLNNKIVRSHNLLKLFFLLIIIKNFFDLLFFVLLSSTGLFTIETIFTVETVTSLSTVIYNYKLKIFYNYKTIFLFIKDLNLYKKYFVENKYHAFNIFIISILSLVFLLADRIIYYYILEKKEYIQFLFYLVIINLFLSADALLYSIIYNKLSKLQLLNKKEILKKLDYMFLKLFLSILALPILITIGKYIQIGFYPQVSYSSANISLVFIYGTLLTINIYEKYNLLSRNRNTKYLQIFIMSIFFISIFIIYTTGTTTLFNLLTVTILVRIIYIILHREIIRREDEKNLSI